MECGYGVWNLISCAANRVEPVPDVGERTMRAVHWSLVSATVILSCTKVSG
jgi:hypothetical protein